MCPEWEREFYEDAEGNLGAFYRLKTPVIMCFIDEEKPCCDACGACIKEKVKMTVRAKFYVHSKTEYSGRGGVKVDLMPVYSDDPNSENKKFWAATPVGKIELSIMSDAGEYFEVGKEYYIDFSEASNDG